MSSPLYLLRREPERLSAALYSPHDHADVVCVLEPQPNSSQKSAVLVQPAQGSTVPSGTRMDYNELLDMVLTAGKIVTL
jgi:hypothetical protein